MLWKNEHRRIRTSLDRDRILGMSQRQIEALTVIANERQVDGLSPAVDRNLHLSCQLKLCLTPGDNRGQWLQTSHKVHRFLGGHRYRRTETETQRQNQEGERSLHNVHQKSVGRRSAADEHSRTATEPQILSRPVSLWNREPG